MRSLSVPPLVLAIVAQLLAGVLIWLAGGMVSDLPEAKLILQGFIASLLGRVLGLPFWWVPVNLLLPLAGSYLFPEFS